MSRLQAGPTRPRIGVLALQGGVAEHGDALAEVGADAVRVRDPRDLTGLDGLVLPGGESTVMALLSEASGLRAALADALSGGLPALGTCAGAIMLSHGAGDDRVEPFRLIDIEVRRNAYGRQPASFETTLTGTAFGADPLPAVFIRAPRIARHGPDVEVLAEHAGSPVAVRRGAIMATTFHPELTRDRRVHAAFMETVRSRASGPGSATREVSSVGAQ